MELDSLESMPCKQDRSEDQKMVLTCSPKIASWIHFNFCNFIPQLSQVETDSTGKRHERKENKISK